MSETTARLLESSFRDAIAPDVSDVDFRVQNEPLASEPGEQRTPYVLITAREIGDYERIKVSGRYARLCELRFECGCAGGATGSDQAVEALAETVRAAVEASAPEGWRFLQLVARGDERENDSPTRIIALAYEARALSL